MKTILDVVQEFRESDPPLTYLRQDESVAYGKFLEFEVVDWNGTTRIVPSEALHLPGRPDDRSFLYRGRTVRYPICGHSLLRDVPDKFDGGAWLYPPDCLASLIEKLRDLPFGLDIVDGHELQPEEEDLEIARGQSIILHDALGKLRFGFRLVRTARESTDEGSAP